MKVDRFEVIKDLVKSAKEESNSLTKDILFELYDTNLISGYELDFLMIKIGQ